MNMDTERNERTSSTSIDNMHKRACKERRSNNHHHAKRFVQVRKKKRSMLRMLNMLRRIVLKGLNATLQRRVGASALPDTGARHGKQNRQLVSNI